MFANGHGIGIGRTKLLEYRGKEKGKHKRRNKRLNSRITGIYNHFFDEPRIVRTVDTY